MHSSSQVMVLRMSVGMGRMCANSPQAMAQVTTTAQLFQCLERVDGWERDGQTCRLKASTSPCTDRGAGCAMLAMAGVQCPSACSREVGLLRLRRMSVLSSPSNGAASFRSARLVRNGMPWLRDHLAWLPNPAPRRLMTDARKATC